MADAANPIAIRIAALALCVALAAPAQSQTLEHLQKGVVRVVATTAEGVRKTGTGFVVRLAGGTAHIVTAAHVVEGSGQVEVEFFTQRAHPLPAKIVDMEGDDPQGLSALAVIGNLPADISVLRMNRAAPVKAGDPVTIIGFPRAGGPWAVTKGEIVGRRAKSIVFSGGVDEGSSGAPLIRDGQVIGVVSQARPPFAYAVPASIAQYTLDSWGVKLREELRSEPAKLAPGNIVHMIREKGFHHPADLSKEGLSGSVIGSFQHEFEPRTVAGDKVVIDHATGLMWQQSGSGDCVSSNRAQAYVGELNREGFAGFSGWRMPTIEELASLLEAMGKHDGRFIDPVFEVGCWWLQSADVQRTGHSWGSDLSRGAIEATAAPLGVLAVRSMSSEAEESAMDPVQRKARTPALSEELRKTRIAFVSERDGNSEIYVMNADGSDPKRLTNDPARDASPTWSPDGSRIAFVSEDDSKTWIQVIKADGSGRRRVGNADEAFAPSWAPDGRRIIFLALEGSVPAGLYVADADGTGNEKRLTEHNLGMRTDKPVAGLSSWSPDGKRIAYVVRKDRYEIHVLDVGESGKAMPLRSGQTNQTMPAWSPDGRKIAFVSYDGGNADIYTIDADGTNIKRLTASGADDLWPSWSPDGSKIVFASQRYGNWEIYLMDADGGSPVRITDSPTKDSQPSWSPFAPSPQ